MSYRILKLLKISEDQKELRSRQRLWTLFLSKNLVSAFGGMFFSAFSIGTAYLAFQLTFVTPLVPAGGGVMETRDWLMFWSFMGGFSIVFGIGGVIFLRPIVRDPILSWLFNRGNCIFAEGKITRIETIRGEKRSGDRTVISVDLENPVGGFAIEQFSTTIWPDGNARHSKLPMPAYFLTKKSAGKTSVALVGIPASAVERTLQLIGEREKRESRIAKRLLFLILGIFVIRLLIEFIRG